MMQPPWGNIFATEWDNVVAISISTFRICKDDGSTKMIAQEDMLKDFFVCFGVFLRIMTSTYLLFQMRGSVHTQARKYTISSWWFSEVEKLQTEHEGSPPCRCWFVRNPIKMLESTCRKSSDDETVCERKCRIQRFAKKSFICNI